MSSSEVPDSAQSNGAKRAEEKRRLILPIMMNPSSPKHFSMIREFHLADFFTLANAACGMGAVFLSMIYMGDQSKDLLIAAAALVLAALIFDSLDGRIARWRRKHSALGRELDSLSDIISFGVAPAALGFAAGMRGGWDWIALLYFVCCGVSRLARFNVTAEDLSEGRDAVAYFEGTPIPTSVLLPGILVLAAWQARLDENMYGGVWSIGPWHLHPLVLLFVLSGTLMVSKTLRIRKV
jgi:CDP-diacylglycerol---serine O-phosphatidyltransferase